MTAEIFGDNTMTNSKRFSMVRLLRCCLKAAAHTSRFFVVELQIFCRDQIGLKFVGPSVEAWSRVIQNQDGAYSTHVTLMTFPNWLSRTRAPTNCLGPAHTSRQGPTRRFEI